jgi:hypothetical protein
MVVMAGPPYDRKTSQPAAISRRCGAVRRVCFSSCRERLEEALELGGQLSVAAHGDDVSPLEYL